MAVVWIVVALLGTGGSGDAPADPVPSHSLVEKAVHRVSGGPSPTGRARAAVDEGTAEPPAAPAAASTQEQPSDGAPEGGFGVIDWSVVVLYAVFMVGLGYYYSRWQDDTEEYFLAGRSVRSFAAGVSMYATLMSTITFLGYPGEYIENGPVVLCSLLALPFVYWAVGWFLVPVFMEKDITSAYELLEDRLGIEGRMVAAGLFVITRMIWMAMLLWVSSLAIVNMMGWDSSWVIWTTVVIGLFAIVYTYLGGLRAVIVSDVIQFFILMGGALLAILFVSVEMGGVTEWWPQKWSSNWDQQPLFDWSPYVRVTIIGSILYNFLWWIGTVGADQTAVQRYFATTDEDTARRALLINCTASVAIHVVLGLTGFALLAFYKSNPGFIPEDGGLANNADVLFPHYISHFLPVGIGGLVLSGLTAAAMSSLDSGINSISAVISRDFLERKPEWFDLSEAGKLANARVMSLGIGLVAVVLSTAIGKIPGNIYEVAGKTIFLFVTPLFSLFVFGLFVSFATQFGALLGAFYGAFASVLWAYWDVFTGQAALSFQWIPLLGLVVSLAVGSLLSLVDLRSASRTWSAAAYGTALVPALLSVVWLLL